MRLFEQAVGDMKLVYNLRNLILRQLVIEALQIADQAVLVLLNFLPLLPLKVQPPNRGGNGLKIGKVVKLFLELLEVLFLYSPLDLLLFGCLCLQLIVLLLYLVQDPLDVC